MSAPALAGGCGWCAEPAYRLVLIEHARPDDHPDGPAAQRMAPACFEHYGRLRPSYRRESTCYMPPNRGRPLQMNFESDVLYGDDAIYRNPWPLYVEPANAVTVNPPAPLIFLHPEKPTRLEACAA